MLMKKVVLTITMLTFLVACSHSRNKKSEGDFQNYKAISKYPLPDKNVNDWEGILIKPQYELLDSIIRNIEINSTDQVILVTVKDAVPYKSLKDFGTDLRKYWVDAAAENRCDLMIAFSAGMRNVWVGTSAETSKILTDSMAQQIINKYMVPQFKRQAYYEGLRDGLLACQGILTK